MPIFNGGPVEKNLIQFIHNIEKVPKSKEIVKGLYWGGDLDYIYNLIRIGSSDKENIKFLVAIQDGKINYMKKLNITHGL